MDILWHGIVNAVGICVIVLFAFEDEFANLWGEDE